MICWSFSSSYRVAPRWDTSARSRTIGSPAGIAVCFWLSQRQVTRCKSSESASSFMSALNSRRCSRFSATVIPPVSTSSPGVRAGRPGWGRRRPAVFPNDSMRHDDGRETGNRQYGSGHARNRPSDHRASQAVTRRDATIWRFLAEQTAATHMRQSAESSCHLAVERPGPLRQQIIRTTICKQAECRCEHDEMRTASVLRSEKHHAKVILGTGPGIRANKSLEPGRRTNWRNPM